MSDDLTEITGQLGRYYDDWKESEGAKNSAKEAFFEAATREVPVRSWSEIIEADNEEDALRIAQRKFHQHNVTDVVKSGDDWEVFLEEDPSLNPYSFINKEDGRVYSRQVVQGSPMLDDGAVLADDPELWDRITEEIVSRQIRSFDDISDEDLKKIGKYLYLPRPTVKLASPRKAKPEELE